LLEDEIKNIKLNCTHKDLVPIEITLESSRIKLSFTPHTYEYENRKVLIYKCMTCGKLVTEPITHYSDIK
jgi:hypothetical protein